MTPDSKKSVEVLNYLVSICRKGLYYRDKYKDLHKVIQLKRISAFDNIKTLDFYFDEDSENV